MFLWLLTFVAVSDRVKVHIILLVGEEEKAEPGVEGIDGDYEEDSHYVSLLVRGAVVTQVHVDLKAKIMQRSKIGKSGITELTHTGSDNVCINKKQRVYFLDESDKRYK